MSCTRINQFGKGIDIGTDEFLQTSMFQDICHNFMFVAQLLQHFFRGDILTCLGFLGFLNDLQFIEEHLTNLFR